MMKILYINHEKNLGGASKCLLGIIDEMQKKGHEIAVLTPYKTGAFNSACFSRNIIPLCVRFVPQVSKSPKLFFRILLSFLARGYNFFVAIYIIICLKKRQIDIIHTNTSIINIGCYLKIFMPKAKHVIHFREFVEEDFGWNFVPSLGIVIKQFLRRSDAQFFISNALLKKYMNFFNKETAYLVYDGVTINQSNIDHKKEEYSVAIVGRLIPGKGQEEAIKALNIIVHDFGFKKAKLYIVGSGDQNYKSLLMKSVDEYKLTENVIFTGFLENVNEFRKTMSYEVYCSSSEGFGRVIIESMLSMNITIAAKAGAFPELIEDSVDGFLYEKGNYMELAKCIKQCFDGEVDKELIKRNAFNKATQLFSQSKNADNIEKIYYKLISKKD